MRCWILAALLLIPVARLAAQNIGINANGAAPNGSAILDIDVSALVGAKKGLLIPRITTVERNAIATPATSLLIFNTTTQQFEYFDALVWRPLLTTTNGWALLGNAGTNPATNFVGTTDAQPLRFRTANQLAGSLPVVASQLTSYGLLAGLNNTGVGSTFIGNSAGVANTTGGSNTFLGNNAGAANVASANNTYVGTSAGAANVNGAQNVYIGRLAGGNGITGSDNILIGNGAGIGNTANNNVMIGSFAGNGNSTGGGNTFMGTQAGSATTIGGQNTFIGTGAGTTNTIGTQNTLIGNGAALNANNLTNATAIGRGSRVDVNDGLVLGSVNGINAATSTSLVGIGTTAPLDRLHVVGNIRMVDGNQALGRVLTSDANGTATWQTASAGGVTLDGAYDFGGAGIGRTITADAGAVTIAGTDGLLTTGTLGSGANPEVVGAGTRMFFNPRKAAFRAGQVDGAQWNTANVGNHSVAMGLNTTASGIGAVALGEAVAATALGSAAIGFSNTASGTDSKAIGSNLIASGPASIALGNDVTTSGTRSAGLGDGLLVRSRSEVVLGMNNTDYVPLSTAVFNAADRLLVVGNGAAAATRSDALVILKNGNTGIGTSIPLDRLHVVGNIRMVDGNQALGRVLVSNANGTATWTDPLTVASGTAWTLTGNAGTNPATNFLGTTDAQPLRLRVGNAFAGQLSNTAGGVVSYGLGAGAVNAGAFNTFLGSNAGNANNLGGSNTFVGRDAGELNTNGRDNTFVGSFAGEENTTGVENTFVGSGTGFNSGVGSFNTFVGYLAGDENTTGASNVFLGRDAGGANLIGSQNIMIGSQAGNTNTTGTDNVIIGDQADLGANNLSNAIAIGSGATVGASNSMVLGDIGVNAVNVGIGMITPLTTLDVLGALTIRKTGLTGSMIADNQLITVGNRSYIQLQSNLGVAASRTVTLSDGLVAGQLLMIEAVTTGSFEIADNLGNNTDVSVDRAMSISDTIMLLWNGTDWLELNYSDN